MRKLYELRDKLCKQLDEYSEKDLTTATLDIIDKLTHTIKNLDKIIAKHEEMPYSNSYGRHYPKYGFDGYSMNGDMIAKLTDLMDESPDERTRMEFQRFIQKMRAM